MTALSPGAIYAPSNSVKSCVCVCVCVCVCACASGSRFFIWGPHTARCECVELTVECRQPVAYITKAVLETGAARARRCHGKTGETARGDGTEPRREGRSLNSVKSCVWCICNEMSVCHTCIAHRHSSTAVLAAAVSSFTALVQYEKNMRV